jgi:hypothetical protein
VLRLLCSEPELGEYGNVVSVGEYISRPAARIEQSYQATESDTVEWRFDQRADAIGYEWATISGTGAAISAVSVQLTTHCEGGWTARLGSAHVEPLDTTSATRRIEPLIDRGPPSPPDKDGHSYRAGHARIQESDERLSVWVITLESPLLELNHNYLRCEPVLARRSPDSFSANRR